MSDQNLQDQNKSNQNMNAQPETASDQIAPNDEIINGNLFVNGKVGIGTNNLQSLLNIGDALGNGYRSWMERGTLVSGDTDNVFFGLKREEGGDRRDGVIAWGDNPIDVFRFIFTEVGGPDNGQEIMRLQPNGNVGIGTPNPQSMLHIGDGLPTPGSGGYRSWMVRGTLVSGDSDNVFFGLKDEGTNRKDAVIAWGDDPNSDVFRFIFTANGGPAEGQEIMRLQPNGKVGIGTTNLQYGRLTIEDGAVPLAFRESDRAVTEGGLWRMPLDAGTLRFDVNTSASGNFSPSIQVLSMYPNGDVRGARDIYANRNVYANGNVGIGTTNLQYGRLTIEDSAVPLAFRESDRAVTEGGLWRMPLDAGILRFDVNTSASGNFSPSIPVLSMYPNGDVRVAGDVYARNQILSSSRELKENIAELSGKEAVEALKNLNPVKFNFKADSDKNRHIGFIAEDVPELVATSDRKTLSPMDIVAVLTQALKEQQNTISALAEKVKLLEAKTA